MSDRGGNQATLGSLIADLGGLPDDMPFEDPGALGSYRGYYEDLAFGSGPQGAYVPGKGWVEGAALDTVAKVLAECRNAMWRHFTGYKGGQFEMTPDTLLWKSTYGNVSGQKVTGVLAKNGVARLTTAEEVWDA